MLFVIVSHESHCCHGYSAYEFTVSCMPQFVNMAAQKVVDDVPVVFGRVYK